MPISTKCVEWSLNKDEESGSLFWWNDPYRATIWASSLNIPDQYENVTDVDVWREYFAFQTHAVYKLCSKCHMPEENEDCFVCCYCGLVVHKECSVEAPKAGIQFRSSNASFAKFLRCCPKCSGADPSSIGQYTFRGEAANARRAALRALTIRSEMPEDVSDALQRLLIQTETMLSMEEDAKLLKEIQHVVLDFFQPNGSADLVARAVVPAKGGGFGILAKQHIPAFTRIGIYPGYDDPLSGEQVKFGRPLPKYTLLSLNCADFFNHVFAEHQQTITPFINEPAPGERSNVAWMQEAGLAKGRLSVVSVRDIAAGEELLLGYGPVYTRDYPFSYDAMSFHETEGHTSPCYALWHWPTTEESDAELVCYVAYDAASDAYVPWKDVEGANDGTSG